MCSPFADITLVCGLIKPSAHTNTRFLADNKHSFRVSRGSSQKSLTAKAVDVVTASAVNTTGVLVLLNGLAPGTAINQRLGQRTHFTSGALDVNSTVTATTGTDQFSRFLVVLDKQPNGAAFAITDVLTAVSVIAPINLSNRNRFVVYVDQKFHLNASAEPGSQKSFHCRMPAFVTSYNTGTAGTIADITTNALYFVAIGDNVAGVTAASDTIVSRLFFRDN
jgi:hypothetical protein